MSDLRWGSLLFAAAFLARLLAWMGSAVFGTDCCHYLLMADWMRAGRFHDALLIAYHPMYPLLIAAARALPFGTEQVGAAISVTLGAAAAIPLFLTVKSFFGRPAAVLTALLYAFHPAVVEVQSDAMTEGTFMFFLFGSMWLTWRMMEQPSLERGAVLGAAAAAAFLTRPEGVLAMALAIGWPALEAIRRRDGSFRRVGGTALTVLAILLLLSPYLLWVRSVRGHWAMSVRPSAISAEHGLGLSEPTPESGAESGKPRLYGIYGLALVRLSLYGALVPFYLLGLTTLKGTRLRDALFYFSFPLGQMGGVLWALRTHNFMADRYIMAGMALLAAVAARGMLAAVAGAARRWPEARWRPALCGAAAFLIVAAPVARCFKLRRTELAGYPAAGRWIRERSGRPLSISGLEQVSYYCGSRSYYLPTKRDEMDEFLIRIPLDYIAYSERDVQTRPEYVAMLQGLSPLEPPLEHSGPPGTWKVYFQKVK